MLTPNQKKRLTLVLCVVSALGVLIALSYFIPLYEEICEQSEKTGAKECADYHLFPYAIWYAGKALDAASVAVTALATLAIAWFTWTLRRSTDRLWKAGEQTTQLQSRAYVSLDGFEVELTTGAHLVGRPEEEEIRLDFRHRPELFITRFAIQPRWKNSGNTPTRNMRISVEWTAADTLHEPDYSYRQQPIPFFIAPGAVEGGEFIEITAAQLLVNWGLDPIGPEPRVFIWGRADYQDTFGREHFVEWCRRVRLSRHDPQSDMRATFIQWGEYNRTDQDNEA